MFLHLSLQVKRKKGRVSQEDGDRVMCVCVGRTVIIDHKSRATFTKEVESQERTLVSADLR